MAENTATQYVKNLVEVEEPKTRDELVQGNPEACEIKLTQPGSYQRGMLLMESNTVGEFIPATAAGVKTKFAVILAEDIELSANEFAITAGYYAGKFKASSVVLAYESESDSHDDLIAALRPVLIKQNINLL